MEPHVAEGKEGDVELYAVGWRDALADLCAVLRKTASARTARPRVPHAFRQEPQSD